LSNLKNLKGNEGKKVWGGEEEDEKRGQRLALHHY
jgi:hypothetical protein